MAVLILSLFSLCFIQFASSGDILCEVGFCRTYNSNPGCASTSRNCDINNATHTGMWMLSPTPCNCCKFCLPLFGRDAHCSRGGPGMGTTVGRCGHGLTCMLDTTDRMSYCRRLETECHSAQDDYDKRHELGQVGSMETRPVCDGKGRYGVLHCVPAQTCFCQSEEGNRIFGEALNRGAATLTGMQCGCSRVHEKIRKQISIGVPYPVVGPRCTADGSYNPVQCLDRTCYCVNRITGTSSGNVTINLDEKPLTELPCYDKSLDLFPALSVGRPPYNYTTPCLERMREMIEYLRQSEEDGYNVDFASSVPGCLPDGTFGRIGRTSNGTKTCIIQTGQRIENYESLPNTQQFQDMDCKCAQTAQLMASSTERPVCCSNGNFRTIQCRRGLCRCVDSDGKQYGSDSADATTLSCYKPNWRDLDSTDCYAK